MKRILLLGLMLIVVASISACTSKESLELNEKEAIITNDKDKIGSTILQEGDNAGKEVVPTSLYYSFRIKNNGIKQVGTESKSLTVRIEPSEKLKSVSEEVMGFNIYNAKEYEASGLGYGYVFDGLLKSGKEGEYFLHYELGYNVKTSEVPSTPSKEQLEKLKANALNGTLVLLSGKKEVARFDLTN